MLQKWSPRSVATAARSAKHSWKCVIFIMPCSFPPFCCCTFLKATGEKLQLLHRTRQKLSFAHAGMLQRQLFTLLSRRNSQEIGSFDVVYINTCATESLSRSSHSIRLTIRVFSTLLDTFKRPKRWRFSRSFISQGGKIQSEEVCLLVS